MTHRAQVALPQHVVTDGDGQLVQTVRHSRAAARRAGRRDAMRVVVLAMLSGLTDGFAGQLTDGLKADCPSLKGAELRVATEGDG
jgi:hypothetical protein